MNRWGLNKKFLLPAIAGGIFFGTVTAVLADEVIRPQYGAGSKAAPAAADDNSKSLLREYTFENSFDKASDSVGNLETSLKPGVDFNCEQYLSQFKGADGKTYAPSTSLYNDCRQRSALAKTFHGEANSIKGQQKIFADVSRVSDIAAVGAVGAVGYAEVGRKTNGQSDTYRGAAKIEKVAGMASYATGAADVTMGAWAYVNQKKKLEQMQATLSTNNVSSGNATLDSNLTSAIEKTKKAAYNHMLWGMGKIAAGYVSMRLAKRSEEQAEMLESIPPYNPYAALPPAGAASTVSPPGGSVAFQTNQPYFSMASASPTSSTTAKASTSAGGMGTSAMPSTEMRSALAASRNANSGISTGASSSPSAGLSASGSPAGGGDRSPASEDKAVDAGGTPIGKSSAGLEISRGGGLPGFAGGGSKSSDDPAAAIGGIMSGIMGGGGDAKNVASGINPDQVYDDATAGVTGGEQGSMAGVNSSRDTSLFDIIKVKHNRALQLGNVQGPAGVEVRN